MGSDSEEHRFLHPGVGVGLDQQVHRPIRLIHIHPVQPRDGHVVAHPVGGSQLRNWVDRPVRNRHDENPVHVGGEPACGCQKLCACGLLIFVYQAAEAVASYNPVKLHRGVLGKGS
jgi:hypothetical protein